MDHITVTINGNEKLAEIVENNKTSISEKVLADNILKDGKVAVRKEWNVNGEKVIIGIEKHGNQFSTKEVNSV